MPRLRKKVSRRRLSVEERRWLKGNCLAGSALRVGWADAVEHLVQALIEPPPVTLLKRADTGERAQGFDQEPYDIGNGLLGLGLDLDGVDDGDELTLGFEAEPHNRPFDGLDHA